MKRFLIACAAALSLMAVAEQKASAWCSFNFSTGLNTSFQCGGVRLFWGLFETAPGPNSTFSNPCWSKGNHCAPQCGQPMCGFPADAGCFMGAPMTGCAAPSPDCSMPYADGSVRGLNTGLNNGIQPIGYFGDTTGLFHTTGYGAAYQPLFGYDGYNYQVPGYWFNQ